MSRKFQKPIVVVSQCLEFDKCRYNGAVIPAKLVKRLNSYVSFSPICPEVQIGLGIPRDPIKLIEEKGKPKLFQPSTNKDLTKEMNVFSDTFLDNIGEVDGFILKFASPSCGIKDAKVFHSKDNPITKRKGPGMFAAKVLEKFPGLAIEDEGRLNNFKIREHFLTKLFLLADYRAVKRKRTVKALVDFQARNKLLFMAYSQKHMRLMGKIVGNSSHLPIDRLLHEYEFVLKEAFLRSARYTSHINVLMHALGYFKDDVSAKDKKYFLSVLDKYRREVIPLSTVLTVIHSWVIKYDKDYLIQQTYFEPFPEELIEITDSGLGRNTKY